MARKSKAEKKCEKPSLWMRMYAKCYCLSWDILKWFV